jgi:hypothetical protein
MGRLTADDLGAPVAHLALKEGVPVYDRSGRPRHDRRDDRDLSRG